MREVKLPHLPRDLEAQQSDLITDVWYNKGKEMQVKKDILNLKIMISQSWTIYSFHSSLTFHFSFAFGQDQSSTNSS